MGLGIGGGLASAGLQEQQSATQQLGVAAQDEAKRNMENQQIDAANKQGDKQLGAAVGGLGGAALGATYGAALGPWGMLLGGVAGAVAGGLFS